MPRELRAASFSVLSSRAVMFAALFWVIAEGDRATVVFGLAVVAAATAASLASRPTRGIRVRPLGLVRLIAFFLAGSLRGGIDVASRALSPRMPLSPGWQLHTLALVPGAGQKLFAAALNLMPGTLSVELEGQTLRLHVLVDDPAATRELLIALQARIADALGEHVTTQTGFDG
jgi:multicomponent Na+:H+ antiporter subunit E